MNNWSRPNWTPTERIGCLFYFVPGEPPADGLELSRSRHHIQAFPSSLKLSAHKRSDNPEWFAGFFARPGFGVGIEEAFGDRADEVFGAESGTVAMGDFADPPDLGYLRDSIGVVSAILDKGGMGVLDMFACRWWSREEWLRRFVDQSSFAVRDHVQIVVTDDEMHHPGLWVHTRGMRKFGRPDLQVKHVTGHSTENNPLVQAAGKVLNSLAEYLCFGEVIEDGEIEKSPNCQQSCTFILSPDDVDSGSCHFGNEVLEVVDVVDGRPSTDLSRLLEEAAEK